MRTLYFDCFAGISGDMTLGAFLDLGVSEDKLISELKKLKVNGYKIEISKKAKNGIMGTDVKVILESEEMQEHYEETVDNNVHYHSNDAEHLHIHNKEEHTDINDMHKHDDEHTHTHGADSHVHSNEHGKEHHHRRFSDIKALIEQSELAESVRKLSIDIFYNVAKAEGKIHGKTLEDVHFHEVGAIDSIVDIVGTAICINELKVDKIVSSPLHIGMGTVKCQHGVIPVPAPATLEILKDGKVPIYTTGVKKETVTPTGAAIIATLAQEYGDMPEGIVSEVGYGAGKRDIEIANMLRIVIVENNGVTPEAISVIEANIDDMSGEIFGYTMEKLFESGALDVFYTPIFMKKNRPAYKLSVLCNNELVEDIKKIVLRETTTIGIREYVVGRTAMKRRVDIVNTVYGEVRVKVSSYDDIIKAAPEYEDCKKIAIENNLSLQMVYKIVSSKYKYEGNYIEK